MTDLPGYVSLPAATVLSHALALETEARCQLQRDQAEWDAALVVYFSRRRWWQRLLGKPAKTVTLEQARAMADKVRSDAAPCGIWALEGYIGLRHPRTSAVDYAHTWVVTVDGLGPATPVLVPAPDVRRLDIREAAPQTDVHHPWREQ